MSQFTELSKEDDTFANQEEDDEAFRHLTRLGTFMVVPNKKDPKKANEYCLINHIIESLFSSYFLSTLNIMERDNLEVVTKAPLKRVPYNGNSPFLISKILLVGFEQNSLLKAITHYNRLNGSLKKGEKPSITLDKPIVLQSFISENSKSMSNADVIDFIFPNKTMIYCCNEVDHATVQPKSVVFSFNIPADNRTKTSHNYYAYTYYEKVSFRGVSYSCPKAICFLSNYPYYGNYHQLADYYVNVLGATLFADLWLYHLVNVPSPINSSLKLYHYYCYSSPAKGVTLSPILFPQLSGYPLFQFNLSHLFTLMPIKLVIEVFLLTFFENDLIFFSENLEVLNMVMYIFANLNYPLNDSSYFFHVVSVSLDTFLEGTNPYVTKTFTSMLGVNSAYSENYLSFERKDDYFIVDLDRKQCLYQPTKQRFSNQAKSHNRLLQEFINKVLVKPNKKRKQLAKAIQKLHKKLIGITPKQTTSFFSGLYNQDTNKAIQESFYHAIIVMLKYFIEVEGPKPRKFSLKRKSKEDINDVFILKLKECSKYNSYYLNFILNNDSLDLFRIPLTFIEEFVYLYSINCLPKGKLFKTIDNYYLYASSYRNYCSMSETDNSSPAQKCFLGIKGLSEFFIKKGIEDYLLIPSLMDYIYSFKLNKEFNGNSSLYLSQYGDEGAFQLNSLPSSCKGKRSPSYNPLHVEKINDIIQVDLSISDSITIQRLKESNVNEGINFVLYAYVMLFIATRQLWINNTIQELVLVLDLIQINSDLLSPRSCIIMLLNQYNTSMANKNDIGSAHDDRKNCITHLIGRIKESKCIPNEELISCLNFTVKHQCFNGEQGTQRGFVNINSVKSEVVSLNHKKHTSSKATCSIKGHNGVQRITVEYKDKKYHSKQTDFNCLIEQVIELRQRISKEEFEINKPTLEVLKQICCYLIFYISKTKGVFDKKNSDGKAHELGRKPNKKMREQDYIDILYDIAEIIEEYMEASS